MLAFELLAAVDVVHGWIDVKGEVLNSEVLRVVGVDAVHLALDGVCAICRAKVVAGKLPLTLLLELEINILKNYILNRLLLVAVYYDSTFTVTIDIADLDVSDCSGLSPLMSFNRCYGNWLALAPIAVVKSSG